MTKNSKFAVLALSISLALSLAVNASADSPDKPNIVVILCDDLGYGDVRPNNPQSPIETPSFDRLAKEGVNFTDAHSGSGVCTPTRYGLVCGRYCWRTRLKRGVLGGYSEPLIEKDQQTIGAVLQAAGYYTGCVGKWHLGLGWQWLDQAPDNINYFGVAGGKQTVDYSKALTDGPTFHGFDESYIIPASLDMSPYVYLKNDRVTQIPHKMIDGVGFPKFYRKGEISDDFSHVGCLSHLMEQANKFIVEQSKTDKPFFLYVPLPAPHKPVIPMEQFQGTTEIGTYGDFVFQVDWTIGNILSTLDRSGVADNTLVIVTSDNGSFMHRYDDPNKQDHVDDESIQGYRPEHHTANGKLRGTKADIYEAGHRVPFFVRWPNTIPAAKQNTSTICLTDILATAAAAASASFDLEKSPDSFSFLDAAQGKVHVRPHVINHSAAGTFAIRDGKWKLVLGNGSGGRQQPRGKPFAKPYQLFDLESDIAETKNLVTQYPEIEKRLIAEFEEIANGDQITPDAKKSNRKK